MGLPDPSPFEWAILNLRDQLRHAESLLLATDAELSNRRKRCSIFEIAAAERLAVIEDANRLHRAQTAEIASLEKQLSELQQSLSSLQTKAFAERQQLEMAKHETIRGIAELASRERVLCAEILELRNEGLINSIIRHVRRLFDL